MPRLHALPRYALFPALLLAAAPLALAQDEPAPEPAAAPTANTTTELDAAVRVVVTATRTEKSDFFVPRAVSTKNRDEFIDRQAIRTFPDALLGEPSVLVQRTGHGQASPFVRGFTGYRNVALIDGIRLNDSTFRSGPNQYWSTIDAYSLERVELVRGISSVLYGSDAVGGTINAIPRRRRSFEPGSHWQRRVYVRGATAERSWTLRGEVAGNIDDLGFVVGTTYKSYGDLVAGSGTREQDQTGYNEADADARFDFRLDDHHTLTFGAQHVDQDAVPRTHKTVDGISFAGTSVGSELRRDKFETRDLVYGRWSADDLQSELGEELELTLSWHKKQERRHRDRDPARTDIQGTDIDVFGVQAQAGKGSDLGQWTYGFEWWHDEVESFRRDYTSGALSLERVQGPVADDAEYDLFGAYVQNEFDWDGTTITAGARWTYARADADRVDNPRVGGADPATPGNVIGVSDSWNSLIGAVHAIRPLSDTWNVWGGVSQGFRAPNLSDLTRLDNTSGVETPSPNLDPEDYTSAEIGVRTDDERWSGGLTYYYTWIEDQIVASPTGRLIGGTQEVRKDNVGDGWVAGVELEGTYRLDDAWSVSGTASFQDGEVRAIAPGGRRVKRPLDRLMPIAGELTLQYHEPGTDVTWWATGRAQDEADELSLRDKGDTERIPPGGTPRWAVLHLGTTWQATETLNVSVILENVTNHDYRIHGSGINEPGRNLVVAVDLVF